MLGTATTNTPNKYEHFVRPRRAAIKGKEEESLCLCVTGGFNAFKSIFSASMAHSNFRLSVLHRKHCEWNGICLEIYVKSILC